jgi:hypothetical protein
MSAKPDPFWIARIAAGQPARLRNPGESAEDYRIAMGWDKPKAQLDADIARLMAAPEAEVDAELRTLGIDPADAERRGHNAVQKALAIFHITRAEQLLQNGRQSEVAAHLIEAKKALRTPGSGAKGPEHG